jgi:hypothetical protein
MTTLEWVGVSGIAGSAVTSAYFIIMNAVDGKIEKMKNEIKNDRIQELIRANERLVAKNEMLKDGLSKLK